MQILENSAQNLGRLKDQIEPLVDFFKSIVGEIDTNVDENLAAFLRRIVSGTTEGSSADEIEAINMSYKAKKVSRD